MSIKQKLRTFGISTPQSVNNMRDAYNLAFASLHRQQEEWIHSLQQEDPDYELFLMAKPIVNLFLSEESYAIIDGNQWQDVAKYLQIKHALYLSTSGETLECCPKKAILVSLKNPPLSVLQYPKETLARVFAEILLGSWCEVARREIIDNFRGNATPTAPKLNWKGKQIELCQLVLHLAHHGWLELPTSTSSQAQLIAELFSLDNEPLNIESLRKTLSPKPCSLPETNSDYLGMRYPEVFKKSKNFQNSPFKPSAKLS